MRKNDQAALRREMAMAISEDDGPEMARLGARDGSEPKPILGIAFGVGPAIEARDESGFTPLQSAAQSGKGLCLKALLDAGARMEERDEAGHTALLLAARNGRRDCAEMLLEKGPTSTPSPTAARRRP